MMKVSCAKLIEEYWKKKEEAKLAEDKKYQRLTQLRKRDKKAMEKGSIEKGHEPLNVIGLKRDGDSNDQVMCKIAWKSISKTVECPFESI